MKNVVNNGQGHTVKGGVKKGRTIITTTFNTQEMVSNKKRKINAETSNLLLALSHYKFRQKLLCRAKEKGNFVIISNESYTSKTCGKCGNLHENLSGNRTYKCENCALNIDRDINGARNILIRTIS